MSIKLGNTDINKLMLGSTEITKAYLGGVEVFGSVVPQVEFIISVKTDNTGTSNNDQFTLPMLTGTYDVDWGDTNIDLAQSGAKTHTYSSSGTYEIKVTGGTRIYFNNGGDKLKLLDVSNWGSSTWASLGFYKAYYGCSNLVLTATDIPDLSLVTQLRETFRNCSGLVYNSSVNNWDVSNISIFKSCFNNCDSFNENIGGWVITSASSLEQLLFSSSTFNQDLGGWNTSSVTNMANVFNGTAFDQNIASWDINQVTNFTSFMQSVTLSTVNYDALLVAWDLQGAMSYSGTVNFGGSKYTSGGAAETARTSLISKWGSITDGGAA